MLVQRPRDPAAGFTLALCVFMTLCALALSFFVGGCKPCPDIAKNAGASKPCPTTPAPAPSGPTCASTCAHLRDLGCPAGKPTKEGHTCEEVCGNVQDSGIVAFDLKCLASATTCQKANACGNVAQ